MKLILILASIFLLSCQPDNLPKYVELGNLRILEIQVDTPEVNPGSTVTLTPYLSDMNSVGALTFSWQACVDPGISFGAEATCEGNTTATAVTTGTVTGLNAGNTYTAAVGTLSVTVPATILSLASTAAKYNGVAYLVIYKVTNTNGYSVTAVKRILATDPSKTTKNSNPVITQVLGDGAALGTMTAGQKSYLSMSSPAASQENYSVLNSDGSTTSATETLQTTWFYSDGSSQFYRTLGADTNLFSAPDPYPTTRSSFIVAVLRDSRGGIAVQKVVIHP
jgi:hypothetical protein